MSAACTAVFARRFCDKRLYRCGSGPASGAPGGSSSRHTGSPLCAFGRGVSVAALGKAGRRGADIDAPARRKGRDAMTKLRLVVISVSTAAAALALGQPAAAQDDAGA